MPVGLLGGLHHCPDGGGHIRGAWSRPRIGWTLPIFVVLVCVGEHAYRRWVRLWRLDRWPDEPREKGQQRDRFLETNVDDESL